jgi:hypothetical protein
VWWVHYTGYGDPVAIAGTLHAAFALTGMPLRAPAETETPIPLDTAALDRIIGVKGEAENGVYHFHVPVAQQITDTRAHLTLPYLMEASTLLMFQPLGGGQAAINGDYAMTADRVNPVIQALQAHGVTIISLHNHLLYESPRLSTCILGHPRGHHPRPGTARRLRRHHSSLSRPAASPRRARRARIGQETSAQRVIRVSVATVLDGPVGAGACSNHSTNDEKGGQDDRAHGLRGRRWRTGRHGGRAAAGSGRR